MSSFFDLLVLLLLMFSQLQLCSFFSELCSDNGLPGARSFNLTPTAPMGGGTQLFEGAHLSGSIRAFVANQAHVVISRFFGLTCVPFNQSI